MASTLREIVENKMREIESRKRYRVDRAPLMRASGSFLPSLRQKGVRVIAEIKPKSPSAGTLNAYVDINAVTRSYSRYAAAISVLTDEKYFGGSFEVLSRVSQQASIPTLCKDFILDEVQVEDARQAGAEAVLLIVKILPRDRLRCLHDKIESLNMVPVVEVQNEDELRTALAIEPKCILINSRNLETFEIDLGTTARLSPSIPPSIVVIAASGIESRSDIDQLLQCTNVFLIGSSLMRAPNLDYKLRQLSGVGNLVKICGITSLEDARAAVDYGADLLGLIFVQESPRYVTIDIAKAICSEFGSDRCVGVFRDASLREIKSVQLQACFKYVQLHGTESTEMVAEVQSAIKAVSVACRDGVERASRFGNAHFVLFDLPKNTASNITVDNIVEWVNDIEPSMPFLIAGGLNPDNVGKVMNSVSAKNFVGVDVASGVESAPGVKDADLLRSFITRAKANAVTR